jgi:glycosyltransferase involved in cell wall biosynthesis
MFNKKIKKEYPLVSIALATYNGEKFISEQLESLMNQTYKNIEIVISDDGSTDETKNIIENYQKKDTRIYFSVNPNPNGFQKNFERVIQMCHGEIVFLCDQDDIWYENKIEEHLKIYATKQNIKWICNFTNIINESSMKLGSLTDFYENYYSKISLLNQIGGRCILGCSTSYRADFIKNIWPMSTHSPSHDSYIQLCMRPSKPYIIEQYLQDYRQHNSNIFGISKKETGDISKNIEKSINYTYELFKQKKFNIIKKIIFLILFGLKKIKFKFKNIKIDNLKYRIYYSFIFKTKTFIRRKINTFLKFNRPTSYPFITGDGFRSIAQHVLDESSEISTGNIYQKDIIFVRSDLLHYFFKKIHPKIKNCYILISHNSDQNIDQSYEKYLDDKIIHWFAQNTLIENNKITPIPIGLQLRFYDKKNTVISLLNKYRINTQEKTLKIFYGFSKETNPRRQSVLNILKSHTLSEGTDKMIGREKYYAYLSNYGFVASPEGNGIDCHRTWEAFYLKTIPILEKNITTEFWYKIGLPVLLINSWKELENIDEHFLKEKYNELKYRFDSPAIDIDYWTTNIIKYKYE